MKKIKTMHRRRELEVNFDYRNIAEFNLLYNSITRREKNYRVYIQWIGIKNKFNHLCARAILKAIPILKIDKILD